MEQLRRRQQADKILYDSGLFAWLENIGEPHVIGSYRMGMMAWNDLDIDIVNERMDTDRLYSLTAFVLEQFCPLWYEAKEKVNDEGKTVWFHGFHTRIDGELWNVDLWFFDRETIRKAETYCDRISEQVRQIPGSRERIIRMKQELLERNLYGFYKYSSMDVYRAVLEQGISDVEELLRRYQRGGEQDLRDRYRAR